MTDLNETTISKIVTERDILKKAIMKAMNDFQAETGLHPSAIDIEIESGQMTGSARREYLCTGIEIHIDIWP